MQSRCVDQPLRQIRHRARLPPGNRITLPTAVEPFATAAATINLPTGRDPSNTASRSRFAW
jgi:hypothetical protein